MSKDVKTLDVKDLHVVPVDYEGSVSVKLDKDASVTIGKDNTVKLDKDTVVTLSDDTVQDLADAVAVSLQADDSSEVVWSASDSDNLQLVCFSGLFICFAVFVALGFAVVHLVADSMRLRHG